MGDQCPDCGDEYQRVNTHLAKSDCEGEGAKTEIECENCGDVFSEYKYRINSDRDRDGTKYCSESCGLWLRIYCQTFKSVGITVLFA